MAKTVLAVQQITLTPLPIAYLAVDSVNGNTFANDGNTIAIIKNASASSITATFTSVQDPYGRIGDVAVTVPAAGESVVGPFPQVLFNQPAPNSGFLNCTFSSGTTVTMALLSP